MYAGKSAAKLAEEKLKKKKEAAKAAIEQNSLIVAYRPYRSKMHIKNFNPISTNLPNDTKMKSNLIQSFERSLTICVKNSM